MLITMLRSNVSGMEVNSQIVKEQRSHTLEINGSASSPLCPSFVTVVSYLPFTCVPYTIFPTPLVASFLIVIVECVPSSLFASEELVSVRGPSSGTGSSFPLGGPLRERGARSRWGGSSSGAGSSFHILEESPEDHQLWKRER